MELDFEYEAERTHAQLESDYAWSKVFMNTYPVGSEEWNRARAIHDYLEDVLYPIEDEIGLW